MDRKIKIIIADDHHLVIDGIKALLEDQHDLETIGEAANGKEVLELLKQQPADLILMDLHMPEMDGLQATRQIKKSFPDTRVLVLTMSNDMDNITQLIESGASGYVLKNTRKDELLLAIREVTAGRNFYSWEVSQVVMNSFRKQEAPKSNSNIKLTRREKEVLQLIVDEFTTSEIAEKLYISENTVETHRKNLLSKLNVRNIAGLVRYAFEHKLLG